MVLQYCIEHPSSALDRLGRELLPCSSLLPGDIYSSGTFLSASTTRPHSARLVESPSIENTSPNTNLFLSVGDDNLVLIVSQCISASEHIACFGIGKERECAAPGRGLADTDRAA